MESRAPRVEAYTRGTEGWLYELVEEGAVEVPCLGVGLPLEAIYEGVPLETGGEPGV